jgi:hypothetical protein
VAPVQPAPQVAPVQPALGAATTMPVQPPPMQPEFRPNAAASPPDETAIIMTIVYIVTVLPFRVVGPG